jgi:hypothetical protein
MLNLLKGFINLARALFCVKKMKKGRLPCWENGLLALIILGNHVY